MVFVLKMMGVLSAIEGIAGRGGPFWALSKAETAFHHLHDLNYNLDDAKEKISLFEQVIHHFEYKFVILNHF